MPVHRSPITPTNHPQLDQALREKLQRRSACAGNLGELEPLAVRLGLMQHTLQPRLYDAQLLVFAADHGLAVDGIARRTRFSTSDRVRQLLGGHLPLTALARIQGMDVTVIDAGISDRLPSHDRLLTRKIAHGTRNARVGPAMSVDQAHAAIRAGMEIADALPGNLVSCAGIGVGAHESAAMVLARLAGISVRDLLVSGPRMDQHELAHLMLVAQAALGRHKGLTDPVEVLAALGGFEVAMMVGVMLVAAGRRHLVMVDGIAACAALMVASRIAEAVTDYCVFSRSHGHPGLDQALHLFKSSALLELGMDSLDGTGATLAWPLVRSAAALLTEVADEELPPAPGLADVPAGSDESEARNSEPLPG